MTKQYKAEDPMTAFISDVRKLLDQAREKKARRIELIAEAPHPPHSEKLGTDWRSWMSDTFVKNHVKEKKRHGVIFTLVELLVVIAIIAILASMLLPSLKKARERTKDVSCRSQEKQIGFALISYSTDNNAMTPQYALHTTDQTSGYEVNWRYQISPYLDIEAPRMIEEAVPYAIDPDKESAIAVFKCPCDTWYYTSSYALNYNKPTVGGGYFDTKITRLSRPSTFIAAAERHWKIDRRDEYRLKMFLVSDAAIKRTTYLGGDVGDLKVMSLHGVGGNFIFADGHVEPKKYPVDNDAWIRSEAE